MPQNDTYRNPGAAATGALFDFLRDREARQRQAMLDSLTQSTAARQDEVARANLDLQREQMEGLREQRLAAADLNRQKKAIGVIGMMQPGAAVDTSTADVIRQGGFGSLIQQGQPTQGAMTVAPEEDPEGIPTYDVQPGATTFSGTPQQAALQRFMQDPNTPPELRAYMQARLAAGDENLPYQLFQGPETQTLFRVSSNRRGVERFDNGTWTTHDSAIPKDAHWITEPASSSGEAGEMRRIGLFNRIADARERSPLVRAADRTIVLRDAAAAIDKNPTDPANQLNLAYSYIQALDTYQSAVREGELQNLGMLGTQLEQLGLQARRTVLEGAFMPPDVAKNIAASAKLLIGTIEQGQQVKSQEFRRRAEASGVGDLWDATYPSAAPTKNATPNPAPQSPAAPAPTPAPDNRTGTGWVDAGGGVRIREKK
jgi:hypothetical protein